MTDGERDHQPPAVLARSDGGAGKQPIVLDEMTTIGRSAGNTVTLDDAMVSRNHALIRRDADHYVLLDLGSANGTFVNNRPISGPTTLKDRDEVKFGDTVFVIQYPAGKSSSSRETSRKATQRFFAEVNIAVLVSDIRNYTILSERIAADRLSALLADWFRNAGHCIELHTGIIEKFRGDSLMAYWMASRSSGAEHVSQAIQSARDMVAASREFDERIQKDYPGSRFKIGCGVHVGDAVLGNIGADSRRDFTTLGDCVNVTFRIESQCAVLDREILVSSEARGLAPADLAFVDLGAHTLKGKTEPVQLFAL